MKPLKAEKCKLEYYVVVGESILYADQVPTMDHARMFAAAPEMLAALKWLAGAIEENPDYATFKNLFYDHIVKTIAKAEGREK